MKVCLGGTFDILHEGHKLLLKKACRTGKEVFIGLATDELVAKLGKKAKSYEERKKELEEFIEKQGWKDKVRILPLKDVYGTAIEEDFDAIIVSPETEKRAKEINEIRRKKGLKELKIIKVPFVIADDGIAIATRRIKNGEIDGKHRLKPLKVCVATKNEIKMEAVREAFNEFFPNLEIEYESVEAETKKQPWNKEILQGAIERARKAVERKDYGVGIEAGIKEENGIYFVEQYVAIADKLGYITYGKSPAFQCPEWIIEALKKGKEMKEVIPFKNESERKKGAVWYFSKLIDRKEITRTAVIMALIPRTPTFSQF
ncbi:MAG: pantetheine-phosphate adenylyltransferase [Thermoplasmata archaeon]|nr:pantetheine-phosphate adenylyltransferase [Thermoplasmata archaeon]